MLHEVYNVKRIDYADSGSTVMVVDGFFGSACSITKAQKSKLSNRGLHKLSEPIETPFFDENGLVLYAQYLVVNEDALLSYEPDHERAKLTSIRRARKEVEIIGRANTWKYFLTLTLAPDKVDGTEYNAASLAFKSYLDRLRHKYKGMEYLLVLEQGGKNGRWHAHALVNNCSLSLVDSGHKVKKSHDIIYNIADDDYDLGFSTVTIVRSSARVGMYISKYIGKSLGSVPAGRKTYWASRNLLREADVTCKYLFDPFEKEELLKNLHEIADRIRRVYIEPLRTFVTYFTIYGSDDNVAPVAPT